MSASQLSLTRLELGQVRWCVLGVATDYHVAPVLNWTGLGYDKKCCLLVFIDLQLFHIYPGGWMDG